MSMLDTLRALARTDAVAVPGNEKNEIYEQTPPPPGVTSLNSFVSLPETVARERQPAPELELATQLAPPVSADELEERAALVEFGANVPRRWAEGYAALCSMPAPAGFSPERWRRIVDASGAFLDRWATEAISCGWSDLDVFGCDPNRPDARFDCWGLLPALGRMEVVGIDADGTDLRSHTGVMQRYRRRPLPPHTIPLWELRP